MVGRTQFAIQLVVQGQQTPSTKRELIYKYIFNPYYFCLSLVLRLCQLLLSHKQIVVLGFGMSKQNLFLVQQVKVQVSMLTMPLCMHSILYVHRLTLLLHLGVYLGIQIYLQGLIFVSQDYCLCIQSLCFIINIEGTCIPIPPLALHLECSKI